ncbi:striatin isoform X2 [Engraulis encrasicolus]|uniref:striatin isoform X2 n=1 Tax=Engraulis encrasicolus TaxID=184585 RepID=UPI002FD2F9AB
MDEQAGPGVFFNNNNNSLLASGGGGGKAPQPGDGGGGEAARAQYSIPGILHFLQHEWARFEVERAQWEVERAELQAQIAFLQGERKGQENLKKDLVRRIKMLEYALKQERAKYHKLKYGTELNQGDMRPPSYDSDEGNDTELPEPPNSQLSWKQGRQLLRQYLQEVGYTDAILDVKSQRVRALLGLSGDSGSSSSSSGTAGGAADRTSGHRHASDSMVNGTEPSSPKEAADAGKPELSDSATVLEAFKFIEGAVADFSDEDDDEDNSEKNIMDLAHTLVRKKAASPSPSSPSSSTDMSDDPDTEEAMKGFDFLTSADEADGGPDSGSADGPDWGPNRSKLQDMLANLRDAEDLPSMQPPVNPPARPPIPRLNDHELGRADEVEAMTFPPSSGKSFILGPDEALQSELGLGELAGLTVANEAESLAYDMSSSQDLRKTWNPKFTLRSHFDSVRALAFHPVEPVLVTASEDHTLKMWNLNKTAPTKKCAALDVEPIYTFRAHRGAVLCVVMSSNGDQCFSGGVDGTIQSWNTPNPNIDPYDSYEASVLRGSLCGHTDSVWGVAYSSSHHRLLSCSADGTVRLWDAANTDPALAVFNQDLELGIPSSVDLVRSEAAHMVSAFDSGQIGIYNMETQQLLLKLDTETPGESDISSHINRVLSHPTLPITITAQEDRHIRFYDNNTGKLIHSMVAHLDAVTSLAVDPNGLYLMSGSHDCSVRLWNMESKTCIQEFTAHRKKFEESIHDVAFHPTKAFIGSAGADALAKVFV